jgi:hypothetical protein
MQPIRHHTATPHIAAVANQYVEREKLNPKRAGTVTDVNPKNNHTKYDWFYVRDRRGAGVSSQ